MSELKEARDQGIPARPVIIGPVTFLLLSKAVDGAGAPIERLDELVPLYADLLGQLADKGVDWVQLDEPVLVTDISADAPALAEQVYNDAGRAGQAARDPRRHLLRRPRHRAARAGPHAHRGDRRRLVYGPDTAVASVPELAGKTLVAGVVDGRNIWRTDLESALGKLASLLGSAGSVAVSTSCSTLHVPYSLEPETDLDDALRSWLAFGAEKVHEVATLAQALKDGRDAVADEIAAIQCGRRLTQEGPAAEQQPGARPPRLDREVRGHASVARRPNAARRRTTGCTCRRCRRPRSGRSRRPSRSARPAPRWSPVRSTRRSTPAGCSPRSPT